MQYTQAYIDELYDLDPHRLFCFDESGFKMPDSGNLKYGYSPVGVRCLEISRYVQTPNVMLNLMISTRGVGYANTIQGASTGMDFVSFFEQALDSVNEDGSPILKAGDTIVVDNCPSQPACPWFKTVVRRTRD